MSDKYILAEDGKTPIKCDSLTEWAKSFNTGRSLKREEVNGVEVSTVFLAIDHAFNRGDKPLLWETMIFGGPHDGWQDRYSSYEDALAGHARACEIAAGTREPE